jgi:ribosomal protein L37E
METALFMVIAFAALVFLLEPILARQEEIEAAGGAAPGLEAVPPPTWMSAFGGTLVHDPAALVLDEIVDLDLEHAAGKIAHDSYATVRSRLVAEAAIAMAKSRPTSPDAATPAIDRAGTPSTAAAQTATHAPHACPHCGATIEPKGRFCTECGHPLTSKKETV